MPTSNLLRPGRVLLILLCLCCNLSLAWAQQGSPVESHKEKGLRLFGDEKKFAEAIPELEEAYRESPNAGLFYPLAQAHFQLGHFLEALKLYKRFLLDDHNAPISIRVAAQRDLSTCEEQVAKNLQPSESPEKTAVYIGTPFEFEKPRPPPEKSVNETVRGTGGTGKAPGGQDITHTKKPLGRPLWRVVVGASAIGIGLLVGGFGVGALAVNGSRVEPLDDQPAGTLRTTGVGAGLLVGGLLVAAGGAVLIAVPEKK